MENQAPYSRHFVSECPPLPLPDVPESAVFAATYLVTPPTDLAPAGPMSPADWQAATVALAESELRQAQAAGNRAAIIDAEIVLSMVSHRELLTVPRHREQLLRRAERAASEAVSAYRLLATIAWPTPELLKQAEDKCRQLDDHAARLRAMVPPLALATRRPSYE